MFAALNRAVKENVTFAEAKEWGIGQRVERVTKSKATPPTYGSCQAADAPMGGKQGSRKPKPGFPMNVDVDSRRAFNSLLLQTTRSGKLRFF